MTLQDIITAVRILLQDDEYDQPTIVQAANWFVYELFNNTRTRLMESSETLTASVGDTSVDFPSDSMAWITIYATVPKVFEMTDEYQNYNDFMTNHANFATAPSATASVWTDFGNAMRFAAPLDVEHTFQFDYVREPIPMEQPSDECEIPGRYIELVSRGAKARVQEIEEDYDYAQQERAALDPLVTAFIRNEARGGGKTKPTVIRTRRGRSSGAGAVRRLGE